jgi:two-component system sensor histidine kinase YesM
MQIDPHFLYNTLYMIYRIAQSEGNQSIARLSLNLSDYYRYITKMPEQIVPLRDEIRHVTNYLEIQRIRFEPRIRVSIGELPEEIAGEMIPSLIIQPIVENAFQHGVRDLEKDGLVSLGYEVEDSLFRVIVSDNSGKMTEESVRNLWAHVTDPDSPDSSALCNLYRRLSLYENIGNALELRCVNRGLTAVLTFVRRGDRLANTADRG